MTTATIRVGEGAQFPGQLKEIIISCDQIDCEVRLNDTQIRGGGGLDNMGWSTVPREGKLLHYCPTHPHRN